MLCIADMHEYLQTDAHAPEQLPRLACATCDVPSFDLIIVSPSSLLWPDCNDFQDLQNHGRKSWYWSSAPVYVVGIMSCLPSVDHWILCLHILLALPGQKVHARIYWADPPKRLWLYLIAGTCALQRKAKGKQQSLWSCSSWPGWTQGPRLPVQIGLLIHNIVTNNWRRFHQPVQFMTVLNHSRDKNKLLSISQSLSGSLFQETCRSGLSRGCAALQWFMP